MPQPPNPNPRVPNGLNEIPGADPLPTLAPPPSTPPLDGSSTRSTASASQTDLSRSETLPSSPQPTTPISQSRSSSQQRSQIRSAFFAPGLDSSLSLQAKSDDVSRQSIYQSFAPRIAVFASPDAEDFIKAKGFEDGLSGLLRAYGEDLQGKVIIRDSSGGSKGWEGFAARFVHSQTLQAASSSNGPWDQPKSPGSPFLPNSRNSLDPSQSIESVIKQYLYATPQHVQRAEESTYEPSESEGVVGNGKPSLYNHYLHKILSSSPIVPYESFSHPVACLICVSSHSPAPIDTLRQLYAQTNPGSGKVPPWVSTEYLRYYVLIHDEENDDLTKSTALFDLMKRHFGLHCHLLKLKSSRCEPDADGSVKVPSARLISAEEELAAYRMKDYMEEKDSSDSYIAESDNISIRAFLREMVVQSVIPFMETRVMTWNDQVASRRRGISGRFMSLSKRFAGFGSSKSNNSTQNASQPTSSNFNVQEGYYPPSTPEATMRQLADYAFMLRDWKLAYTTYDILRSDYGHDKAWQYHAAANEMAAITSLLNAHSVGSRYRADLVDQMLDSAVYSYLTRCSMPWGVIRSLTIAVELLTSLGPICADDCRRWGSRLLESDVLKPYSQAVAAGRVADCYGSRLIALTLAAGSRKRQAAHWNFLTSGAWVKVDRAELALARLQGAASIYKPSEDDSSAALPFPSMQALWTQLSGEVNTEDGDESIGDLIDTSVQQVQFDSRTPTTRRLSMGFPSRPSKDDGIDDEGFMSQDAGGLMYDNNEV